MKKLIFSLVIASFVLSCSKHSDSTDPEKKGVKITGKISLSKSANSLGNASKVLVFNSSNYSVYNIENGSVTAIALPGTASALSFIDGNNKFIGCLYAGGLNVLPLVSLVNGDTTVIDLSSLTLDGTSVIPSNNPLGNEIGLDEDEIEWYKEIGSYYEAISKNIDVDNNGIVDILDKKQIRLSSLFVVHVGKWGTDTINPQVNDTSEFNISYMVRIEGGNAIKPENRNLISLSGPEGEEYTDLMMERYADAQDCFITFFRRSAYQPLSKGLYTFSLGENKYTLNYSNICPKHFLILAEPTVHTNIKNEVVSISMDYKLPDNTPVSPENFIYLVQLQIMAGEQSCQIGASLYESPETNPNLEKYNFSVPNPIAMANLFQITVCYQDLLGNEFDIVWRNNNN